MTWQDYFRSLKAGWDSYGGIPIDERAIAAMEAMLPRLGLPLWLVPCAHGGVQAECFTPGNVKHFEADVSPDGLHWACLIEYGDDYEQYESDSLMSADELVAYVQKRNVQFNHPQNIKAGNFWTPS